MLKGLSIELTARRTAWLVVLALVLSLPSLAVGFFCDDYIHLLALRDSNLGWVRPFDLYRFAVGDRVRAAEYIAHGPYVWWMDPGLRAAFFRPVASALEVADFALFHEWAVGFHLHSMLWYGAFVAVAATLYRRTLPPSRAWLALLLFAVDGAHGGAVAWLAARYALVAATFSTLALAAYWRFRTHGERRALVAALCAYAVALGAGESALGLPCFLAAFETFSTDGWRRRIPALLPFALVSLAYLILHRARGYGAWGSGLYADPLAEPLRYLAVAPGHLLSLFGAMLASSPVDLALLEPRVSGALMMFGTASLVAFGALFRVAMRDLPDEEQRTLKRLALGAVLAVVPALGAPVGSRLLTFASVGVAPAVAAVVVHAWRAHAARALVALLLVAKLVVAPIQFLGQFGAIVMRNKVSQRTLASLTPPTALRKVAVLRSTDPFVGIYGPYASWFEHGQPYESWNVLAVTAHPLRITRRAARELDVEVLEGQLQDSAFELVWRRDNEMPVGYRVHTDTFDVTVVATERARPTRLRVTMNDALDGPSTAFVVETRDGLKPFVLPDVGQSVVLPRGPSALEL